jgi:hypothetical protein
MRSSKTWRTAISTFEPGGTIARSKPPDNRDEPTGEYPAGQIVLRALVSRGFVWTAADFDSFLAGRELGE